ncbi:MAG: hypothetical protein LBL66_02695 [Clostridiales bacterium]|jgi:hypothetical protein|nr:hypothetical protein [Clostridiales bacterium]
MRIKKLLTAFTLLFVLCFSACSHRENGGDPSEPSGADPYAPGFASSAFAAPETEEPFYTTNQMAWDYLAARAIPTDAQWVYGGLSPAGNARTSILSYIGRYEKIGFMCSLSRDFMDAEYPVLYTASHPEIKQTTKEGVTLYIHDNPAEAPHVYPSEGFARHIAGICKTMIAAGASSVVVEEPDGRTKGYNNALFKAEWLAKYGVGFDEDWAADNAQEFRYKRAVVISDIFVKAYQAFTDEIKDAYPDVKVYFASHPTFDYAANHHVSANNRDMLAVNGADGYISEAWTDTATLPVFYEGENKAMYFEQSFMQYNEGANYLRGLDGRRAFAISDSSADTESIRSEQSARPIWQHTIAAQLLIPQIYSYNSQVWPDRGWQGTTVTGGVRNEYRAVQEGVIQVHNAMHKYGATRFGGTPGIGVVMSYTAESHFSDPARPIYSMMLPLLKRGIQAEIIILESLVTADALKSIKILVLSYDFIKPEYAFYNAAISDWVKDGGVLVYIGGENLGQNTNLWWKSSGYDSPQAHLFDRLGLGVANAAYSQNFDGKWTKAAGAPPYFSDSDVSIQVNSTAYTGNGIRALFSCGNETVAFEKKAGGGAVIVAGCEPEALSSDSDSYTLYEMLLKRACEYAGLAYRKPGAMYVVRGPYEIYHTFDNTLKLEGSFIDLFDDHYAVRVNPEIPANASALYARVSETGLAFTNATVKDLSAAAGGLTFTARSTPTSIARAVINLPDGATDATVTATDKATGAPVAVTKTVDGGILRFSYSPPMAVADFNVQVTYIYGILTKELHI